MGYFSNSDSGLAFEVRYCSTCIHNQDDEDSVCPVMAAHLCFQGERAAQPILDLLIVRAPLPTEGSEQTCKLYIEAPGQVPWRD